MPYVEQLIQRLSSRDWDIISTLHRIRLATGPQLERLHFNNLTTPRSRSIMRWRVLKQLTDLRALTTLKPRIGGSWGGSAKLSYALDSAGQRLARMRAMSESGGTRVRRPRLPGDHFVAHTLAVTELYVTLVERSRLGQFVLEDFQVEGAAYWPDGLGGWIKDDALIKLRRGSVTDYWWYEADLPRYERDIANESLPTIQRKLLVYLDFVDRGQLGPDGIVPRILFGVPTDRRQAAIQTLIRDLRAPAHVLFHVALLPDAPHLMIAELMKPNGG
jgi:hypothetical protein